jgi:hypothetical protein
MVGTSRSSRLAARSKATRIDRLRGERGVFIDILPSFELTTNPTTCGLPGPRRNPRRRILPMLL